MTQVSRPWAGTVIGDAGPYTAINWWDVWQAVSRGSGALTGAGNRGVFARIPGRLEVTYVGPNFLSVAAGGALIDGLFYQNDAAISVTVTSATAGNVRDDILAIRKYFSSLNQTARLVLLAGSEVASPGPGTPPALTQDTTRATYWDIPLAQVSITDAGVITLTDLREYIDTDSKQVLWPVYVGYDLTTAASVLNLGQLPGILADNNLETRAVVLIPGPKDAVLDSSGSEMLEASISLVINKSVSVGGEDCNLLLYPLVTQSLDSGGSFVHAAGMCYDDFELVSMSAGGGLYTVLTCDITAWPYARRLVPGRALEVLIGRDAADAADTLEAGVYLIGVLFEYLAYA